VDAGQAIKPNVEYRIRSLAFAILPFAAGMLLCGCQTPRSTGTLYEWHGYQPQVYQYFKGESVDRQIIVLEKDLEIMRAHDKVPPPGYYAHLGMLYANVGKGDRAVEMFENEKKSYPESSTYMDFLLKKKGGKSEQ
jgi:hypothetical protein